MYARRKEWPLLDGDKYVVGNLPPRAEGSIPGSPRS